MDIRFLGLGVQKGGTSTLHDILRQHSQLYLPQKKEAHFFDLSERYEKGLKWLEGNFFLGVKHGKIVGKFTPEYLYVKEVPERIAQSLGKNIKFIVVLRHPVDRAVSHYNMIFRRGEEKLSFYDALKMENERIKVSELFNENYSYMSRGYYSKQIKRYFEIFPRENFLFLAFEKDIVQDIEKTIDRIQDFLGVNRETLDCSIKSNEAYTPRFVKLNQFLKNNKGVKRVGDTLVPKKTKIFILSKIYKWNKSIDSSGLFHLERAQKKALFETYFSEDAEELKELTGIDYKTIWNEMQSEKFIKT